MRRRNLAALVCINMGVTAYWWVENFWINLYWVREVDPSAFNVAVMVAVSAVVGVLTHISIGALSDASRSRFGRRRAFILWGSLLGAVAMALFPVVRLAGNNLALALWLAVVLDSFITFFGDMTTPTRLALFKEHTTVAERGKYNAYITTAAGAGALLILALYWTGFSQNDVYFYLGGAFLAAGGIACFLLVEDPPWPDNPCRVRDCLREIFRREAYRAHPNFYHLLAVVAWVAFAQNVSGNFLFIYLENTLALDQASVGFVGMASSVFSALVLFGTWISDRHGRKPVTAVTLLVGATGTLAMFWIRTTDVWVIVACLGLAAGTAAAQAVLAVWVQDACPEEMTGSLLAYLMVAQVLPMVPGSLLGGFLADALAPAPGLYSPAFFLANAVAVLLAIPVVLRLRETVVTRGKGVEAVGERADRRGVEGEQGEIDADAGPAGELDPDPEKKLAPGPGGDTGQNPGASDIRPRPPRP